MVGDWPAIGLVDRAWARSVFSLPQRLDRGAPLPRSVVMYT